MKSILLPICGAFLAVSTAFTSIRAGERIVIKGSDTLGAKMVPQLVEAYRAAENDVEFVIAAEGSSTAFTNLLAGTCDIGMASREAKPEEIAAFKAKGLALKRVVAAADMIAVIVNETNPLKNLSLMQVEEIFTEDITDWSEVGGKPGLISVYTRNTSSGTYKSYREMAMRGRGYGENTQKLAGSESPSGEVSRDPRGIAYVGVAYCSTDGVKPLAIDNVPIALENHARYPITRHLLYYTVGEPKGAASKFLRWATTDPEALEIIERVGFVAIRPEAGTVRNP